MAKSRAQLEREIAAALAAPRVANRTKLEALLQWHAATAAMWRAEAEEWKKSTHHEAADELRHAQEFTKEHDQLAKKISTASLKWPGKLVELSRLGDTPEELHMSEEDVWGPDEEE